MLCGMYVPAGFVVVNGIAQPSWYGGALGDSPQLPAPLAPPAPEEGATCPVCPAAQPCASLPSSEAADDLLRGKPGALFDVIGSTLGRAALVGVGAFVFGLRGKDLLRAGIGGAVGIEVFVLGYTAWKQQQGCESVAQQSTKATPTIEI
jgi:hypothetical protein